MEHPSAKTLKRFASGATSRRENREVVAHLLQGCAACAGELRSLMEPPVVGASAYDAALDRVGRGLVARLEAAAEADGILADASRSPAPWLPKGEREA